MTTHRSNKSDVLRLCPQARSMPSRAKGLWRVVDGSGGPLSERFASPRDAWADAYDTLRRQGSAPDGWLHEGEWARVGAFYIYPRDGQFHIGKPSGAFDYRDVETGFANMQAAIDHARWMVEDTTKPIGRAERNI